MFHELSTKKWKAASKFLEYQNSRGGAIKLQDVIKPTEDYKSALSCLDTAVGMEKANNDYLIQLSQIADANQDPHLSNFIDDFLNEQVTEIKRLSDFRTGLKRDGPGLGEYMFDKETLQEGHGDEAS